MALTWIVGILIIDELAFLAYLYPIMIGLQGVFIFLIFVVFSKGVREAYRKCWNTHITDLKVLSKVFKSRTLSSNLASHSNGKVCKFTIDYRIDNYNTEKYFITKLSTTPLITMLNKSH